MKKYLNKLHYRSWHRGTKEADLFLGSFFDKYKNKLNNQNIHYFEHFLKIINDNDIMLIAKGQYDWPKDVSLEVIELLEDYIKSEGFRK
jgi:antitoxin CptB